MMSSTLYKNPTKNDVFSTFPSVSSFIHKFFISPRSPLHFSTSSASDKCKLAMPVSKRGDFDAEFATPVEPMLSWTFGDKCWGWLETEGICTRPARRHTNRLSDKQITRMNDSHIDQEKEQHTKLQHSGCNQIIK